MLSTVHFPSVQLLSHVRLFTIPWTAAPKTSLSITIQEFAQTHAESVMPANHLILCRPLLLLPSIFPSVRVFSNESVLSLRWPEYWSFSISPSNEYSGLISFRIDWFDLLAAQGTLKSFLQGNSLVVQWLRLCASNAGGVGLIPGQGTRIPHAGRHKK